MKRIIEVIAICFCIFFSFLCTINAEEKDVAINDFINFINDYNKNNVEIYNKIDKSNKILYNDIRNNINKGTFSYEKKISIKETGDKSFKIVTLISGSGKVYNSDWSVSNRYIFFDFKYDENKKMYILTDTDLFESCGIRLLEKSYKQLFLKALIISFLIFLIIMTTIYLITRNISKKDFKKYLEEKGLNEKYKNYKKK